MKLGNAAQVRDTMVALGYAIYRVWEPLTRGDRSGPRNCFLCSIFRAGWGGKDACHGCPVYEIVGSRCGDIPEFALWEQVRHRFPRQEAREAAKGVYDLFVGVQEDYEKLIAENEEPE